MRFRIRSYEIKLNGTYCVHCNSGRSAGCIYVYHEREILDEKIVVKDGNLVCYDSPLTHQYGSSTRYSCPSSRMPKVIMVEDGKMVRSASAQARIFRPEPNCLALHKGRTSLRSV